MAILTPTNNDYLIENLRVHLWDIDPANYRYADEWLRTAIVHAIKNLQTWWNYKYLINETTYDSYRNTAIPFLFPEPPIIEQGDERPIVLMASIIIKEGTLENSAWTTGSWKDAEISYSNISGADLKQKSLAKDWEELTSLLKVPQKRLAGVTKGTLPGYLNNQWEGN